MSPPPLRLLPTAGCSAAQLQEAFSGALAGQYVLVPLPPDPVEAAAVEAMVAPALADPALVPAGTALVVSTSGSTGRPKGVMLSAQAIEAAACATHDRLGGAGEWTLALGAHYVAGAMVVCRTVVGGTGLRLASPDLRELAAKDAGVSAEAGAEVRRYLSVVPTQLSRGWGEEAVVAGLRRFDAILVGGAAPDPGLWEAARAGGLGLVATYGMSETCGGCVYDGLPLAGTTVSADPATGRLSITGPTVFSGYLGRDDLTAQVLGTGPGGTGTFHTDDRGHVDAAGRVSVQGRMDEVVISGGVNIDLAQVQAAAREVLGTTEAVALGVPDAVWGTRVVVATTSPMSLAELRTQLAGRLAATALPRGMSHCEVLPLTSSGKIDRRALVAQWADAGDEEKETV